MIHMRLGTYFFALATSAILAAHLTACDSDVESDGSPNDAGPVTPPPDDAGVIEYDGSLLPPDGCTDQTRSGTETDVDCGGSCTTKCALGKTCFQAADCATDLTCIGQVCLSATATNNVKDGTETDVDCGGGAAPKCDDTEGCADGARDCTSGVCKDAVCQPPSPTDTVKNGTETDVDCGGAGASTPRCAVAKVCVDASDCFQPYCLGSVCAEPPSCRVAGNGANTCGPNGNESCCTTIAVPGGSFKQLNSNAYAVTVAPYKLDKYEITQGRMRAFYAAYGGNLRGNPPTAGAGAHPLIANSGWQSVWNDRLPRNMTEVTERLTTESGCFGAGDAHTWTDAPGANDAKAVNCVDWYTLASFCIWDGGRLPTEAEWGFAGEGGDEQRMFSWGNVPNGDATIPVGSDPNTYGDQVGKYAVHAFCTSGGPSCFSYGTPYRVEDDGPAHIAPPGQKLDIGRYGHHDMSGNLIELTLDNANGTNPCSGTNCARVDWPDYTATRKDPSNNTIVGDRSVGGLPSSWRNYGYDPATPHDMDSRYQLDGGRVARGGSWERVHPVSVRTRFDRYPIWRAYYAMGGRCARD